MSLSKTKPLRVLVLVHPTLIPPKNPSAEMIKNAEWRTEYDVIRNLKRLGHDVYVLGILDDLGPIRRAVYEWEPHIAFNLLEEFDGVHVHDQNVISYLELMKVPYTGCSPRGLMLSRDKALTKKVLAYHRIPVPKFHVFRKRRSIRRPKSLEFPLIVKSLTEEASLGISQASVVTDDLKLIERVRFIHESVGTDAIVESYIEGREFYVGVLGNRRTKIFPMRELIFKNAPDQISRIATQKVKWDPKYRQKYGITTRHVRDLPKDWVERIEKLCKRTYRVLQLNGYARMDLRVTADGGVYLLEVNPNPHIGYGEDFAESADKFGLNYPALLDQILQLGMRWQPGEF